jgi:hypothetical protein
MEEISVMQSLTMLAGHQNRVQEDGTIGSNYLKRIAGSAIVG